VIDERNETEVLLSVRGITKEYPGLRALDGVNFDVRRGEVHCLLGQNGAGKSTLIKCVSGLVEPTAGEILFEGNPLPSSSTGAALSRGIVTIYQELDLVTDLTVYENVWLGHEFKSRGLLDKTRMIDETRSLLNRIGHEELDPRVRVDQLSPAAQQIVSIARALSRSVRLLIMDEPSAVLGDREIEGLFEVVKRLTAEGVGVIYISHRLDEVSRIGDRVTVLKDGSTVLSGVPADHPPEEIVRAMVGRRLDHVFPDRAPSTEEVVLEVKGLTLRPHFTDVSFTLKKGEILGIAGLVGSGRSELMRAIYGLEVPDEGEVFVDGRPLAPGRPHVALANGLGFAPEDRKSQALLLHWTSAKNVSLADLKRFRRGLLLNIGEERKRAGEQLDAIGTEPGSTDRQVRELSGGNQQKVVLARWLLRAPGVLFLDEPTRGVDVGAKTEIYRVVAELAEKGLGILMVSSEFPELLGFCDRILVTRDGRIVREAKGGEISEEEVLSLVVRREPVAEVAT